MGYSPWGCKESDMTEATWHARRELLKKLNTHSGIFFFFFVFFPAAATAKSLQSCPTLCDPIPGILQARTLEWVAISFSNA